MNYEQNLEARVNELQDELSAAEEWVPRWVQNEWGDWYFKSQHTSYGYIRTIGGAYRITVEVKVQIEVFPSIDDAMNYVEALAKGMKP